MSEHDLSKMPEDWPPPLSDAEKKARIAELTEKMKSEVSALQENVKLKARIAELEALLREAWGATYSWRDKEQIMIVPAGWAAKVHAVFFPNQGKAADPECNAVEQNVTVTSLLTDVSPVTHIVPAGFKIPGLKGGAYIVRDQMTVTIDGVTYMTQATLDAIYEWAKPGTVEAERVAAMEGK